MQLSYTHFLLRILLFLVASEPVWAQVPTQPNSFTCGVEKLTPVQAKTLQQQALLAFRRKMASGRAFTTITYVPIRPHIVRKSDGTGGLTLTGLNQMMAYTNSHYLLNGYGIQFYFAGATPDYINNDELYTTGEGGLVPESRDAPNAMNQYYVYGFTTFISGYASYPSNSIASTRSFIGTGDGSQPVILGNQTIPHELGHNFNLIHTHGSGPGNDPTDELVTRGSGANCSTAGDLICDTPADPFGMPGANLISVNGCDQYDPNSTARDANGDPYSPSISNIMSYWSSCTHDFTPGQYDRMQAGLALRQTHTAYTLNAPATNVNSPTNLSASLNGLSITLTWQDNASNEMGYFIERSTSPTDGFVPVSGVAPDITTFTDNQLTLGTRYYYRIRPSNTILGNLSPTVSVNSCPTPTSLNSNPTRISASLNWTGITGQTYTLHWRPTGNSQWTTISNVTVSPYSLTGLTSSTAYEWQVQGVCSSTVSSDFTAPQSFTTLSCQDPVNASAGSVGGASAVLGWYASFDDPGRTSELRYRVEGTSTWTTISSLTNVATNSTYTASTYRLTGLSNNTTYEWQLRNICSSIESSGYTPIAAFTTNCRIPTGLSDTPTATRAALLWTVSSAPDPGTTFDVQYRPVGSTAWNTISAMGNSFLTLTGLTTNTQYEWQVRTVCSASSYSDFSATKRFTTVCNSPSTNAFFTSLGTSTSIRLAWNVFNDVGTQYDIRYRPVGASNWLVASTTSVITAAASYTLVGLTSNTTYEWQVRTVCSPTESSTFVAGPNFATLSSCPVPINLSPNSLVTSTLINWSQMGPDVTYEVHYRVGGTTDWTTTISNLTTNSVNITGLHGDMGYDYQVRTRCSDGSYSDFSSVRTFYTSPCTLPINLATTNLTIASAQLNWGFPNANAETRYQARYRQVGTTNWILLNDLSSTDRVGSALLTGLSANTSYEWQIRTLCSATESSDFTDITTFQTLATCPNMYTIQAGSWNDPTVWSCNRIPVNGDIVQIKHQVTIPASYMATAQRVSFDIGKTVSYGTNAQLKVGF